MFDFLSIATINPTLVSESDILVLNSTAFVQEIKGLLSDYNDILLFLDNDEAGRCCN